MYARVHVYGWMDIDTAVLQQYHRRMCVYRDRASIAVDFSLIWHGVALNHRLIADTNICCQTWHSLYHSVYHLPHILLSSSYTATNSRSLPFCCSIKKTGAAAVVVCTGSTGIMCLVSFILDASQSTPIRCTMFAHHHQPAVVTKEVFHPPQYFSGAINS